MELTEDQILQKYAKQCLSCYRNGLLLYVYEWTCLFCSYTIIKQKHELTKKQQRRKNVLVEIKIW